jgi:molybdenum cofactor sulfurtransferase
MTDDLAASAAALGLEGDEAECRARFEAAFPAYARTAALDEMRRTEFARLDAQGQAYLDYTGASLYADRQVHEHLRLLRRYVLGNPHSTNPASRLSTSLVESARSRVLEHFGASADDYAVIFTHNATAGIKLVAESFPFGHGGELLLTYDNHNSVNGMREYAVAHGAEVTYVPLTRPDLRVDMERLGAALAREGRGPRLFAFPAQSNFTGVRHPLDWIERAHSHGWQVLLDAAAFVPTARLDLGRVRPEFAVVSFYKMFGYPTGVGALLARRDAAARLTRPWYAGGTTVFSSVQGFVGSGTGHRLLEPPEGFEDGTPNFLAIPAVEIGLDFLSAAGLEAIGQRTLALTGWLIEALGALRHPAGTPCAEVYGPLGLEGRGANVLFNALSPDGARLDATAVQEAAAAVGISVRSGCHCNPGGCEVALDYAPDSVVGCGTAPMGTPLSALGHLDGALRASFGIASNFSDAYRLVRFVAGLGR